MHAFLINVLEASNDVLIRIDVGESDGAELSDALFRSLSVSGAEMIHADKRGFIVKDYEAVNPAAVGGGLLGILFWSFIVCPLISKRAMARGWSALPAVVIPQVFVFGLQLWGREQNGWWTVDPLQLAVSISAIIVFWAWARLRWTRLKDEAPMAAESASSPPRQNSWL